MADLIKDDVPEQKPEANATPQSDPLEAMERRMLERQDRFESQLVTVLKRLVPQQGQAPAAAPTTTPPAGDPAERLLENPEQFIGDIVRKAISGSLGTHLQHNVDSRFEQTLSAQRAKIDSELGQGRFDSEILPVLNRSLESLGNSAAEVKDNPTTVSQIISSIRGEIPVEKLSQWSSEAKQASEKAEADKISSMIKNNPEFLPIGLSGAPPAKKLSSGEEELVRQAHYKAGVDYDVDTEVTFRDALNSGKIKNANDYAAFVKAQEGQQ